MVALLAEGVDRNLMGLKAGNPVQVSPSSRRAWIEISRGRADFVSLMSPSSRRAWIEIALMQMLRSEKVVALLAEGVDRNARRKYFDPFTNVALLAEGVDRNTQLPQAEKYLARRPPRGGRG